MSTETLTPDELRTLFLFEGLSGEQLAWVAEHAGVEHHPAQERVIAEGDPATCFYVLLSGTLRMCRMVHGDEVELIRTEQRGVYCGATEFLVGRRGDQRYSASVYAVTDLSLLTLPAAELGERFVAWFPMAAHLLEGMFLGRRNTDAIVGRRERLVALGQLSAGLTHELNNPAAAAVRATSALRERVAGMRQKLALLARNDIDPDLLERLIDIQELLVKQVGDAPRLSAMQTADREDELADWFDEHDVADGWNLAAVFVPAGITVERLEEVRAAVGSDDLATALRWLGYAVETEALMGEIEDATTRISALVGKAKQYSQMDRAPFQWIDVHDGLTSTLVMLSGRIGTGVRVVKEFDGALPEIPAYAGELNQVWTNLIENALGAMGGQGTLTIRTRRDNDRVLVEICDTGPGVPADLRERIFEPFFTTKPVGEGTGLGLDISWRIVVNRHHGDLRVTSEPGDTRFQVFLPLTEQPET
ncbi:ATP-binding protein [Actinoallomurus spadix]|uniref:histidine kinase n=1 Tax=Actinoallomurus spadix TaxID=79912 RepID=A0ABN0X4Z1_9ACTN|nr:ATP-binding protein [Actinoallomurus spadix]MCO5986804.1 ATP-binding protein [Actinoallomurus spadix]